MTGRASVFADPDRLVLRARVRHVISEALRVAAAERALENGDLLTLGELMNDSHRSCAGDYGVSTPSLDRLVEAARTGGALGARLTGAGFGGAIVALVGRADVERLLAALDREFYAARSAPARSRFMVEPADGAATSRSGAGPTGLDQ